MNGASDTHEVQSFVVIGRTNLARRVCASLRQAGHIVDHLTEPGDEELREALSRERDGVAVLLHDDAAALRYALAVAHMSAHMPIIVTIFDRTVADELLRLLPQCDVTSPADLVAPALAGPCVDAAITSVHRAGRQALAVQVIDDEIRAAQWQPPRPRWRSRLGSIAGQLRPHDAGTRIMFAGMVGMFAGMVGMLVALVGDWAWLLGHGHHPAEALFEAARVVSTVGPADAAASASRGYYVMSSLAMLGTIVFSAMFTVGLIDRMLGPKLVGLIGPRTVPRFGHVIVVGIGQVGLRLCSELRSLGIPVVGVERDPHAPNLRLARSMGIPVMVGHGGDRAVLEQLRLGRARALAAVGSDDLDNIDVAIAAQGVSPNTRIVLRAGEHEAIAETRSLLPLGIIRDVTSLAAAYVLARLLGTPATGVIAHQHRMYVESPSETFSAWPLAARAKCPHVDVAMPV